MQNNEAHKVGIGTDKRAGAAGSAAAHRIIIAGGGTGGHIFPAIAIAHALRHEAPATQILFVGANGKMEMEKVPQAGYNIRGIDIAGFNRSSLIKNLGLPFKLLKSFFQVRRIVRDFTPDAVVGVGGYSSFPVLRLAQAKGIPTFIHESNSFAGKSNILLGKKATKVFVASGGMERFFPAAKISVTGNPVRKAIASAAVSKNTALQFFGLKEGPATVLVVGGSLGAKSINEAIDKNLEVLLQAGLQVIWQTGKPYIATAKQRAAGKTGVWVGDFIGNMEQAYAAADVVVSRAGAMAIAELALLAKPVLFVPYPFAAEDHQTANAQYLVQKGAALMINDNEALQKVAPLLLQLAADKGLQQQVSERIKLEAVPDADKQIANEILATLNGVNKIKGTG